MRCPLVFAFAGYLALVCANEFVPEGEQDVALDGLQSELEDVGRDLDDRPHPISAPLEDQETASAELRRELNDRSRSNSAVPLPGREVDAVQFRSGNLGSALPSGQEASQSQFVAAQPVAMLVSQLPPISEQAAPSPTVEKPPPALLSSFFPVAAPHRRALPAVSPQPQPPLALDAMKTDATDVLGGAPIDDLPPQDFSQDVPPALQTVAPKPPPDPAAEDPLPRELAFLVPKAARQSAPPTPWSTEWQVGDPATGASVQSHLVMHNARRSAKLLSLRRDSSVTAADAADDMAEPMEDLSADSIRALFKDPKRHGSAHRLSWRQVANNPETAKVYGNYVEELKRIKARIDRRHGNNL